MIGWGVCRYNDSLIRKNRQDRIVRIRDNENQYTFVHPLLGIEIGDKELFVRFKPLQEKLDTYVKENIKSKLSSNIAAYFRDLDSGRWTGVNENEKFAPASMLKVLVMMSYLKAYETNPDIMVQKFSYDEKTDGNFNQNYKPTKSLEKDKKYTTEELITRMIRYSDNNALNVLAEYLGEEGWKIYRVFGLPTPNDKDEKDFMSPKAFSLVFRTLFNSTYLQEKFFACGAFCKKLARTSTSSAKKPPWN